jgi:hypothetical protein
MIKLQQLKDTNFLTYKHHRSIQNWRQFAHYVRGGNYKLLCNLDDFSNSILVAGCQRSGTTALSRLITESSGMTKFSFGKDDELDAALILSGQVKYKNQGRHCFQTTYLNNNYCEYFEHQNYKLIWVLRNPYSVVYSMLNNWKLAALNRLFKDCGVALLSQKETVRFKNFGTLSISKVRRACFSYAAKTSQTFDLKRKFDGDRLIIIDYDELVQKKEHLLPKVYFFLGLDYRPEYANKLNKKSLIKAKKLSDKQAREVDKICLETYQNARKLISE